MMTALNIIVTIIGAVAFARERAMRKQAEARAERFEDQANNTLAELTKEQRRGRDLAERLRQNGKAWAAAVKRAQQKR